MERGLGVGEEDRQMINNFLKVLSYQHHYTPALKKCVGGGGGGGVY